MKVRIEMSWVYDDPSYYVKALDDDGEWRTVRVFKAKDRQLAFDYAYDLTKFDKYQQTPNAMLIEIGE